MAADPQSDLSALGTKTDYRRYAGEYDGDPAELLERFPAPNADRSVNRRAGELEIEIQTSEFSCLCPLTGQPDWATIVVRYEPREWCVESKSFKLYLMTFRQAGAFHEAVVTRIGTELVELLDPERLEVEGQFTPRGGIRFWPRYRYRRDA